LTSAPGSFDFLFDVGGPNGYLVHKVLPDFCARTGATVTYVPVLLGGLFKATGNRAPMIRYADAPAKLAYEQLEFARFIDAHDLKKFHFNPHFPVNSLLIMRIIAGAQKTANFLPTIEAMMSGLWEEGLNLADPVVVAAALTAAGLDGEALVALADDPSVKAALVQNTEDAVARGAFGIPTFFVGEEMFFGKERLTQVEAAVRATAVPPPPAA
jgi:2-hydroxychromene-2-carboxylate isomerase